MGRYLIIQSVYFGFLSARNMFVCALLCFAKQPYYIRDYSSVLFICFDFFSVIIMTIYGTKALFSTSGVNCRDNNGPDTFKWWVISMCFLIYDWGYGILLCIGFTSLPLIIVFWCFYRM